MASDPVQIYWQVDRLILKLYLHFLTLTEDIMA